MNLKTVYMSDKKNSVYCIQYTVEYNKKGITLRSFTGPYGNPFYSISNAISKFYI